MKRLLIITLAAMALSSCSNNKPDGRVSFDEVIASRRSVRSYDPSKSISEDEVRALLLSTQQAPSWP